LKLAEIVADVDELTAEVETLNVPLVAPALTVTFPGTVAAALLLASVTVAALDGGEFNVAVP
jgi:hypothetical protein